MTIEIQNGQSIVAVTEEMEDLVRRTVRAALEHLEFEDEAEVSVIFTDNEGIRALNLEHRNMNKPTDVLSFPLLDVEDNVLIIDEDTDVNDCGEVCLGDIVISLERACAQAEEYGHSLPREICFLTVHSMLHLLGYDHMTDEEEQEMFALQKEILNDMGIKR